MSNLFNSLMLAETERKIVWSWNSYFKNYLENDTSGAGQILPSVFNTISIVLWVILGLVGAIGAIYAIFLGVQLARADEQGKRDDAKKHLITVFIALGATIALIMVFNTFLPAIISAFTKPTDLNVEEKKDAAGGMIKPLLSMLKAYL